jgi:IstB-like ATP binding protein/MMPL family
MKTLAERHPDVLLLPENESLRYFAYSAPLNSFVHHDVAQTRPSVREVYPNAFSAIMITAPLDPGKKAIDAIRSVVAGLDLASRYQARVRLTGPVPIENEEFATVREGSAVNGTVTLAEVLLILWMALKSFRPIVAVVIALFVGLSITAALGLMMVGALNLISVAFAVLFVGLGVDFGIQFSVPNQSFSAWNSVFPVVAMTAAAVDRLVHHATVIEMNGESYRKRFALRRADKDGNAVLA